MRLPEVTRAVSRAFVRGKSIISALPRINAILLHSVAFVLLFSLKNTSIISIRIAMVADAIILRRPCPLISSLKRSD